MINVVEEARVIWKDTAWTWVIDSLKQQFHRADSKILFFGEVEYLLSKHLTDNVEIQNKVLNCESWIGISHQHIQRLQSINFEKTIQNNSAFFQNCKCIITLSKHTTSFWLKNLKQTQIYNLYHPFPKRKNKFSFLKFKQNPAIRSLGSWGRSYAIWNNLQSPYTKLKSSHEKILPFDEFDDMLTHTIQFIDFQDASASNGIMECMRRNTPLLVRRHPAVIEYLGEAYPLYFDSLEEANEKVNDYNLLIEAHEFIIHKNKNYLDFDFFMSSLKQVLK